MNLWNASLSALLLAACPTQLIAQENPVDVDVVTQSELVGQYIDYGGWFAQRLYLNPDGCFAGRNRG